MDCRTGEWMDRLMDGWTVGETDGQMDGWTDMQTDRWIDG